MSQVVDLARRGAFSVQESFSAYHAEFKALTRRARRRFEERDWSAAHADALERLELRGRCLAQAVEALRAVMGGPYDPALGPALKSSFARDLAGRSDPELAKTFFNSVTRRVYGTVGVVPEAEFTVGEVETAPDQGKPIHEVYPVAGSGSLAGALESLLRDQAFGAPWRDLAGDVRLAAHEIARRQEGRPTDALEVLRPVFFRGKGAYLVGRLRGGEELSPCILALLHEEGGMYVDAVLLAPQEASVVFSFTRSYFHVEVDRTGALVAFLKSLLPSKKTSELYIAIGYNKHGKTVLYREIVEAPLAHPRQLRARAGRPGHGDDRLHPPLPRRGVQGHPRPLRAARRASPAQDVMQKYALVFRHDRAGRLVDAQEFEHLIFERERFATRPAGGARSPRPPRPRSSRATGSSSVTSTPSGGSSRSTSSSASASPRRPAMRSSTTGRPSATSPPPTPSPATCCSRTSA